MSINRRIIGYIMVQFWNITQLTTVKKEVDLIVDLESCTGGTSLVFQRLRICLQCWRHLLYPCVRKIPCRRDWLPTPVFLPGDFFFF